MSGRRMIRGGSENRRSGSKNLPTILSRKRKSEDDDPLQPVGQLALSLFYYYHHLCPNHSHLGSPLEHLLTARQLKCSFMSLNKYFNIILCSKAFYLFLTKLLFQDIQSYFNALPKSSNSENFRSANPPLHINRPSR